MTNQGDFSESVGKDVDPLISEISVMKQLIKERSNPLDLVRELLSNAGAKEVGAKEIYINYYVNQDGHVFEVRDDGCGMGYTGDKTNPGRLDRFLGLGLSAIVGAKSDEFSWKGLGSKLAYQSFRVEVETYRAGDNEVFKAEISNPWGTIERNAIPKPRIYRFPPVPGQRSGTRVTVVGHPPHRKEQPFSSAEIESFLLHRTFAGFTRDRETKPRIVLTVMGVGKELEVGFPELRVAHAGEGTNLVDEKHQVGSKEAGNTRRVSVHVKGFYTWDADTYGLSTSALNTGLILSVKGIPYFQLSMEDYGSRSLRTASPGEKKCCLIVECDAIQEEMNISRSGLVDSEMTDLFKRAVGEVFSRIESSSPYLAFRQIAQQRKTTASATALDIKKRKLESPEQKWVVYKDEQGRPILLGREPENENDALAILWKMEAMHLLPFAQFKTLAHAGDGPDLIVNFQEDKQSQPDRYTVIEAERFFYSYEAHGHAPSQYPRVICWDIGRQRKGAKIGDTKFPYKKVTIADGVQVNIFCISRMPGISVVARRDVDSMGLL